MARQTTNWGAFVLEFIGSLVYLYVAYGIPGGILSLSSPVFSGVGGWWLPLFVGAAALGSVALFFISFGHLTSVYRSKDVARAAMCATVVTGLALVLLTYSNITYLALSLLGFILAFIGSGLGYKE